MGFLDLICNFFNKVPAPLSPLATVSSVAPDVIKIPTRSEMLNVAAGMVEGTIQTRVGPYRNIKETSGNNRSPAIDKILVTQGGEFGDPYCQYGQQEFLDELCRYYDVPRKSVDLPKGGSTQLVWSKIPDKYKRLSPSPLCWVTWRHSNTGKGHVGMCFGLPTDIYFKAFEFNTSVTEDGSVERDGQGAHWTRRSVATVGDMEILGYADVYQAIVDAMAKS